MDTTLMIWIGVVMAAVVAVCLRLISEVHGRVEARQHVPVRNMPGQDCRWREIYMERRNRM